MVELSLYAFIVAILDLQPQNWIEDDDNVQCLSVLVEVDVEYWKVLLGGVLRNVQVIN